MEWDLSSFLVDPGRRVFWITKDWSNYVIWGDDDLSPYNDDYQFYFDWKLCYPMLTIPIITWGEFSISIHVYQVNGTPSHVSGSVNLSVKSTYADFIMGFYRCSTGRVSPGRLSLNIYNRVTGLTIKK
jgi:hypothetical protein